MTTNGFFIGRSQLRFGKWFATPTNDRVIKSLCRDGVMREGEGDIEDYYFDSEEHARTVAAAYVHISSAN